MAKDGTNRGGRRVRAGDKPTPLADKMSRDFAPGFLAWQASAGHTADRAGAAVAFRLLLSDGAGAADAIPPPDHQGGVRQN